MGAAFDYFDGVRPMRSKNVKLLASDALPLPLWLTNRIFLAILSAALYYFWSTWGEKKARTATLLTFQDIVTFIAVIASLVYMLGFFGIDYVQNFIGKSPDDHWDIDVGIDAVVRNCDVGNACRNMPVSSPRPQVQVLKAQALMMSGDDNDEDIAGAVSGGFVASHSLEAMLGDAHRAASIRKRAVEVVSGQSLDGLPLHGFDYNSVLGQCCELVIGHVQIPVGVAGPLMLDNMEFMVPMATTEGCLVASTNRGCKAIHLSGGASSFILKDGMTRAPVVSFERVQRAADLKLYLEHPNNIETLSAVFNRSSRYARLQCIQCALAGRHAYLRFSCTTGDAMGMNMISKGVHNVLDFLQDDFPDMDIVSLSGNYCTDKKASAVNWINGRGKSVVCEAVIKGDVVTKVLKTTVRALVELNMVKNLVGSAIAATLGGFNAHASNIVSAIFIATGQDPAQNVESSNCITIMESTNGGHDLHVSVTMPSIEVGTIGGGTQLASQAACLNLLGVKGANRSSPGANAQQLARVVAGAVLAGELSLMSALAAGHLVKSHMKYNRSANSVNPSNA